MKAKRIVIALGGNALGNTPEEQLEKASGAARAIADLIAQGHEIIVTHGNGPQVGMINLGMDTAAKAGAISAPMPFPECGAMSQGYIGYHLQNCLGNELAARGIEKTVAALVTQVVVDPADPAFRNPTKPIGAFYTREEADKIAAEKGFSFREDAGRGWRRVVPSPRPVDVVEKQAVRALLDSGATVIASGGGGIPVIREGNRLTGVPAVIDKDFSAAALAELVQADELIILTAVDQVAIHFGKPNEQRLARMTVSQAKAYCEEGHFAPGSMLPKVQAALAFAQSGGAAVIASLARALDAVQGKGGTRIVPDGQAAM